MRLTWIPSFAVLSVLVAASIVPRSAEAFDSGKTYEMFIINGYQKIKTGTLISTSGTYVDADGYEACRYSALWNSAGGTVASPVQLFFDELLTPGYLDCDVNTRVSFPTLIVNSPGRKSSGVDKFQQGQTIQNLILVELLEGGAVGIITFGTNLPYPLLMKKKS